MFVHETHLCSARHACSTLLLQCAVLRAQAKLRLCPGLQAAESRLIAAAQQWGYWRQDGSIVLGTNIHTVITATAP